jgi:eukaryotic-like serine/threonine-protein kinase
VITLTLLHPVQSTPVQSWTFENESVVRIGRSVDNHVVLYSAVVSRHHVELRHSEGDWEVVNLGTNGTYLDGKRIISQAPLKDGGILRLARSGPNLQIRVSGEPRLIPPVGVATPLPPVSVEPEVAPITLAIGATESEKHSESVPDQEAELAPVGVSSPTPEKATHPGLKSVPELKSGTEKLSTAVENDFAGVILSPPLAEKDPDPGLKPGPETISPLPKPWDTPYHSNPTCNHARASRSDLFCISCGQPLKVLRSLGPYQLIQSLGSGSTLFNTFLSWRSGYSFALKTLDLFWLDNSSLMEQFQQEIHRIAKLVHPGLPRVVENATYQGHPILVTEMIHGPNLQQWVKQRGPVKQDQAIAWAIQLCETLDYLHGQDPPIVHQNIKPSTLIRPLVPHTSHEIMLVNLGHISLVNSDTGTFTTTFGYTAPELQAGDPMTDSDLFSLGSVLVYLLTGREPDNFYRWGEEEEEFRLFADDIEEITPQMKSIINRLTHPEPNARFPSARALSEKLRQLQ